jgi:hypothetical protein
MKTTQNVIRIISILQRLGFVPDHPNESDSLRYVYPETTDKLEFEITAGADTVFAQLTWHRDSRNFDLVPFDVMDSRNRGLVSLEHLENIVKAHIAGPTPLGSDKPVPASRLGFAVHYDYNVNGETIRRSEVFSDKQAAIDWWNEDGSKKCEANLVSLEPATI